MKTKINSYISSWENRGYYNGIPDEAPAELESAGIVPSYRMICRAILKNDIALTSLGFTRSPCVLYNELKRAELLEKGKIKIISTQLGLFGGEYHECI
jgi:predicted phosphoadenosine phosphosulfate sulfurtransferase